MELDLSKEVADLISLGYRIKSKQIKYIYSHNEIIGYKVLFEISKKVSVSDYKDIGK